MKTAEGQFAPSLRPWVGGPDRAWPVGGRVWDRAFRQHQLPSGNTAGGVKSNEVRFHLSLSGAGHEQVDRCSPPRRPIGKARSRTKTSILDGCDVRTRDRNAASRDGSAARAIELFMTGPLGSALQSGSPSASSQHCFFLTRCRKIKQGQNRICLAFYLIIFSSGCPRP